MHQNHFDVSSQDLSVKITIKELFQAVNSLSIEFSRKYNTWKLTNKLFTTCSAKEMLHQGLKVKNSITFRILSLQCANFAELVFR